MRPKETKPLEARVGLVPEACAELARAGHELFLEAGAGVASGYPDESYTQLGVTLLPDAEALYGQTEIIVKVKEPFAGEPEMLRRDHLLFCFLHLAANSQLTHQLLESGVTAVAFETLADRGGLPVLAPMSDIAGRLAVQIGTGLLHQPAGGKGILLGGLPAAMGAEVTVFDRQRERMAAMRAVGDNVTALYPYSTSISAAVAGADLLIGAVLIPGAKAPHLVSKAQVASMQAGSVVIDISVDQGGCIETTRPTTYESPTFMVDGIIHFGVTNMPGAVPRSASQTLSAALLPYLQRLAAGKLVEDEVLSSAVNVSGGKIVHPVLRDQYL
ncbi:MAG: alanine dehydrogenase [endosymbiont of Escarpia spicata]|uniref:alanine dehydrogenase n=1 Tax=endosymbiont of Escarpia spicata TaxID=2200908 RepID=A0A370DN36_9GAMM|nr:MAG: alanine dehydrogenase [endosymbiont of Escarpia spicata]